MLSSQKEIVTAHSSKFEMGRNSPGAYSSQLAFRMLLCPMTTTNVTESMTVRGPREESTNKLQQYWNHRSKLLVYDISSTARYYLYFNVAFEEFFSVLVCDREVYCHFPSNLPPSYEL